MQRNYYCKIQIEWGLDSFEKALSHKDESQFTFS